MSNLNIRHADELGSGVRKMFKYGKAFAGADPTLVEDDLFHSEFSLESTIFNNNGSSEVSINDPVGEAINDAINDAIKSRPGVKKVELVKIIGKSKPTIERAIALLKQQGRIEYRGSKKTGGYFAL